LQKILDLLPVRCPTRAVDLDNDGQRPIPLSIVQLHIDVINLYGIQEAAHFNYLDFAGMFVARVSGRWRPVQGKRDGANGCGDRTQTKRSIQFGQSFTT